MCTMQRDETEGRIRGRKLQAIRKRHFDNNPLCIRCAARGRVEPATELDHIIPLFKGGADDDDNRQGLCHACHAIKTNEDIGRNGPAQRFDVEGYPVEA